MICWECKSNLELEQQCDCSALTAKNVLGDALASSDRLGEGLDNLLLKIKKWKESSPVTIKQGLAVDRNINRCIHYLCLMADELEEKVASKKAFCQADINELEQKALYIAELAKKLTVG